MTENKQVVETIGSITKQEQLAVLNDGVLENTMVLRSVNPFPGIDNESEKPGSIFIILRYRYAPEKINRINYKLWRKMNLNQYPGYGEIITNDGVLPCVRLKGLNDLTKIIPIQSYLKENDLKVMSYRNFNSECKIKIYKSFRIIEIGDGLYRDLNDGDKFYIRVGDMIKWNEFQAIVKKIKSMLQNPEFDAATGVIYRFLGPEHVVRIYDHDKTFKRAVLLRQRFLNEIKHEKLLNTI